MHSDDAAKQECHSRLPLSICFWAVVGLSSLSSRFTDVRARVCSIQQADDHLPLLLLCLATIGLCTFQRPDTTRSTSVDEELAMTAKTRNEHSEKLSCSPHSLCSADRSHVDAIARSKEVRVPGVGDEKHINRQMEAHSADRVFPLTSEEQNE